MHHNACMKEKEKNKRMKREYHFSKKPSVKQRERESEREQMQAKKRLCNEHERRERMAQTVVQPLRDVKQSRGKQARSRLRWKLISLNSRLLFINLTGIFILVVGNLTLPRSVAGDVGGGGTGWPERTKYVYEGPDGCSCSGEACYCTRESRLMFEDYDNQGEGFDENRPAYALETLRCANVSGAPGSYLILKVPPSLVNLYLKWDDAWAAAKQEFRRKFIDKIGNILSKTYQWTTTTGINTLLQELKDSFDVLVDFGSGRRENADSLNKSHVE